VNVHEYDFEVKDEDEQQSRIYLVPFDDIKLGTERRYLIKGLIPRTGLVVVWGPPKSGKSFKIFDMLLHIALNRRYRGRRVHPGPVVYCSFEGQTGFEARCAAFRKKFLAQNKEFVPFYLQPVTLDLIKEASELIRVIQRALGAGRHCAGYLEPQFARVRIQRRGHERIYPGGRQPPRSVRLRRHYRSPLWPRRESAARPHFAYWRGRRTIIRQPRRGRQHRYDCRIHERRP
jgi:hypothetical protein